MEIGQRIRGDLRRRCWDMEGLSRELEQKHRSHFWEKNKKVLPLDVRMRKVLFPWDTMLKDKELPPSRGGGKEYLYKAYWQGDLVFAFSINTFDYWWDGVHSNVYLRFYKTLEPWLELIPHYPIGESLGFPGIEASIV